MLLELLCIGLLGLSSLVGANSVIGAQQLLESPATTAIYPSASGYVTGIGMDLTGSYGQVVHLVLLYTCGSDLGSTVAVAYANGTVANIAKVDGPEAYLEMMLRLSFDSSKHLTYTIP